MSQTYMTRQKKPPARAADAQRAAPHQAEAPHAGVTGHSALEGGMGERLDERIQARMTEHFGGGPAAPEGLDGVQVHYNSPLPGRVDAEAYTQGDHIYLAAGQERHLPHELGHVMQQRRGHVPTTERISGLAANTNPALEHEADVLGQQFAGITPEISSGVGTFGGAPSAVDASAPIQMAGHKGVMQFGNGTIIKRIEKNEYDEYRRVMEQQTSMDVDPETRRRALAAFPHIYGVYTQAEAESGGAFPGFEGAKAAEVDAWIKKNGEKLQGARAKAGGDEPENEEGYYVQMESMGGSGFEIKDFKVGTFTANSEELYQHGHKGSRSSALKKEKKMRKNDDARSETARYGLRDSDEIQKHGNPLRKFLPGQRLRTLDKTREQFKGGRYNRGGGGGDVSQVIQDLNDIEEYFMNSDTVYVASSVIIKWAKEGGGDRDQARLIDLAHPIRRGKASDEVFQAAREGMLLGIRNVKNLLLGDRLQEAGESRLPIGVGNLESKTPGGEKANPANGIATTMPPEQTTHPAAQPQAPLDEDAVLDAYGQRLRSEITAASQNVTADTPANELLTGNRLYYMRSNSNDQEKGQKKQVTDTAMRGVNEALAEHMRQSTLPEMFQQGEIRSPGQLATALRADPTNERLLEMQRQSDEIGASEIEQWLNLMRADPRAMSHFDKQVEKVYRPMGAFDPQNNKGGIVGGEQNAGIYALNDLFLRSSGPFASIASGGNSPGSMRTQMGMKLMNRMFNKTGDVDSMDENERRIYDQMLQMSAPAPLAAVPEAAPAPESSSAPEDSGREHRHHRHHRRHHHHHKKAEKPVAAPTAAAPAPAQALKTAPVSVPKAAEDEFTVEELRQMAQNGVKLTVAQRRRIYGG